MSLLLIILFSMFSSVAYGMTEEDYVTDNLDEISDISRQHITQILQDKKGFLWLSSWNGLYRFDGDLYFCLLREKRMKKHVKFSSFMEAGLVTSWTTGGYFGRLLQKVSCVMCLACRRGAGWMVSARPLPV